MTDWLPPEDIRATVETQHELGPDYRDAVIESFLEKVDRQIGARIDARLVQQTAPASGITATRPRRLAADPRHHLTGPGRPRSVRSLSRPERTQQASWAWS